jgi:hypothetical protein
LYTSTLSTADELDLLDDADAYARLREGLEKLPTADGDDGGLVYWSDLRALLDKE